MRKLIVLYHDNHITMEGNTSLTYSDEVSKRFGSYHWHVQNLGDNGNDVQVISEAFTKAKSVSDKPFLIILRTHIGYGSPNKQGTSEAASPQGWCEWVNMHLRKPEVKNFRMDALKEHCCFNEYQYRTNIYVNMLFSKHLNIASKNKQQ